MVSPQSILKYTFKVTIYNDTPKFKKKLYTLKVTQGDVFEYEFPEIEEKEALPITFTIKYQDSKLLPSFMKMLSNENTLRLSPTNETKPALYLLKI
jgi:hypothetical protein